MFNTTTRFSGRISGSDPTILLYDRPLINRGTGCRSGNGTLGSVLIQLTGPDPRSVLLHLACRYEAPPLTPPSSHLGPAPSQRAVRKASRKLAWRSGSVWRPMGGTSGWLNRLPAVLDGSGRSPDMKVSPAVAAMGLLHLPRHDAGTSGSEALPGQNGQSVSGKERARMRANAGAMNVRARKCVRMRGFEGESDRVSVRRNRCEGEWELVWNERM